MRSDNRQQHFAPPTEAPRSSASLWQALLPALHRLDRRLAQALGAPQEAYGAAAAGDPFRGLHISEAEIMQLLDHEPGWSPLWADGDDEGTALPEVVDSDSALARLARLFGLSPFDQDVLLIALAPEIDLRYERLYAYLQDDVTRRRPTVDLALNLLCCSAAERLARRRHFTPAAPLLKHQLLRLLADSADQEPPLLRRYLTLDGQITSYLLGSDEIDVRSLELSGTGEAVADHLPAVAGAATGAGSGCGDPGRVAVPPPA